MHTSYVPGDRVQITGGLRILRPTREGVRTDRLFQDKVVGWGPEDTIITRWSETPLDPDLLRRID